MSKKMKNESRTVAKVTLLERDIIPENLKYYIRLRGYKSIALFSNKHNIDNGSLSRILSGKREPLVSTLIRICKALDITLNDTYLYKRKK